MFSEEWLEYITNKDVNPTPKPMGHGMYVGDAAVVYDYEASDFMGKDIYRVVQGFSYITEDGKVIVIPTGYLTDGASVPKIFRGLINPWGRHARAAIVHDVLCDFHTYYDEEGNSYYADARVINTTFREAMSLDTVTEIKKRLIYAGVDLYFKYIRPEPKEKNTIEVSRLKELYRRRVLETETYEGGTIALPH